MDTEDGSEELVRDEEESVGRDLVQESRGGALHKRLRSGAGERGRRYMEMEGVGRLSATSNSDSIYVVMH